MHIAKTLKITGRTLHACMRHELHILDSSISLCVEHGVDTHQADGIATRAMQQTHRPPGVQLKASDAPIQKLQPLSRQSTINQSWCI